MVMQITSLSTFTFLAALLCFWVSLCHASGVAQEGQSTNLDDPWHGVALRTMAFSLQAAGGSHTAGRQLLTKERPNLAASKSPAWGYLRDSSCWLLTLGKSLTVNAAEQSALLNQLQAEGVHLAGYLPTVAEGGAAWLLVVPDATDLPAAVHGYAEQVYMAPLNAEHKVSPELQQVLLLANRQPATADAAHRRLRAAEVLLSQRLQAPAVEPGAWEGSACADSCRNSTHADCRAKCMAVKAQSVVLELHFPSPPEACSSPRNASSSSRSASCPNVAAAVTQDWLPALIGWTAQQGPAPKDAAPASATATITMAMAAMNAPARHGSAAAGHANEPSSDCKPPHLDKQYGQDQAVVDWLASAPQVTWLAPRMAARAHNLVASAICQSGGLPDKPTAATLGSHPLWQAGITGAGQVIGCGDSGVDMDSCYFYDANPAAAFLPNVRVDTSGLQYYKSETHRKVKYYLAFQDLMDGYGHGTHVAGTLLGSRYDATSVTGEPIDYGQGQAPGARLSFLDLSRGPSDNVWTPGDLAKSYYQRSYDVGARVHSDSWGSEVTVYDGLAASLDRFTWNNKDFLPVVAAGNYGDSSAPGASTVGGGSSSSITSPAVAKNCLTVGAVLSVEGPSPGALDVSVLALRMAVRLPGGQQYERVLRVVQASFGGAWSTLAGQQMKVVLANPLGACQGVSNAGGLRGSLVLVQRGGCYVSDKLRSVAAAGAQAALVYNNMQDGYFALRSSDAFGLGSSAPPMGGVPATAGAWISAALASGAQVTASIDPTVPAMSGAPYDSVAGYSSFGPTPDGRIKPDIVAPGFLLSAATDKQLAGVGACGTSSATRIQQGTSMATPVVAGSAALVRAYFMGGYYPPTATGAKDPARAFSPSGALVKAVLINGAAQLRGSVSVQNMNIPLEDAPSHRQGYGRVDLSRTLPLAADGPWRMRMLDSVNILQGKEHRYCVRARGGPLRITLVWHDWPGQPLSSKVLVNDLDLLVRPAGLGGLQAFGNTGLPSTRDTINNVEQVSYEDVPAGDVSISVSATTIFAGVPSGVQPYALVVGGAFSGELTAPDASGTAAQGTCAVLAAVIDRQLTVVDTVGTVRSPRFFFSTQTGVQAASGYECRLSNASADASNSTVLAAPLHTWRSCTSPYPYSNLPDSKYSFQVRVVGETLPDSFIFTVDSTPPSTSLVSTLLPGSPATTASDNVTFIFTATDVSPTTQTCSISFSGPTASAPLRIVRDTTIASAAVTPITLGTLWPCTSPLKLAGLSFGDYAFSVRSRDQAGNVEVAPAALTWSVRYTPSTVYARFASGPVGILSARSLSYRTSAFVGAADAAAAPSPATAGTALVWALWNQSSAAPDPNAWQAVPDSGQVDISVALDGRYWAGARASTASANATLGLQDGTWALASVVVDTTPPTMVISAFPSGVSTAPRVTMTFADSLQEEPARVACRWLGPNPTTAPDATAPDSGASAFGPCLNSNATQASADATHAVVSSASKDVTNGYWLFQVKAWDLAGNEGQPASVKWRTDTSAPNITDVTLPPATNVLSVAVGYTVDDGPLGTGVANISCRMSEAVRVSSTLAPARPGWPSPDGIWETPCRRPAQYTVQEGRYSWSIQAVDRAGLRSSADYSLIVDTSPPTAQVAAGGLPVGRALPSRVMLDLNLVDRPASSPSGVALVQALLQQRPASPPSPPAATATQAPATSSTRTPPAAGRARQLLSQATGCISAANFSAEMAARIVDAVLVGHVEHTRRLQQASGPRVSVGGNGSTNSTAVVWDQWQTVSVPLVYEGLNSGPYTLQVRAIDAAGNVGQASDSYSFTVDSSLPLNGAITIQQGSGSGGSDNTRRIIIGVVIAVGVAACVTLAVVIVVVRKRRLKRAHQRASATQAIDMPPIYTGHTHPSTYYTRPMPMLPSSYGPAIGVPVHPTNAPPDPALAAALAASMSHQQPPPLPPVPSAGMAEHARLAAATAASVEDARMRAAIDASLREQEEAQLRKAISVSSQQQSATRTPSSAPPPPPHQALDDDEARLQAAIRASLAVADAQRMNGASKGSGR